VNEVITVKNTYNAFIFVVLITGTLFAGGNSMLLDIGTKAPDFTIASSDGDTIRLGNFVGKNNVVLIFYPGDATPGCTKQLCAVRDDYSAFEAKEIKCFGVNPANTDSHRKFIKSHNFQFPLLIDNEQKVAKLYGCNGLLFVKRTVYAIDKQGTIVFAQSGMPSNNEIIKAFSNEKAQ
jgi:peroxiredoxin Q/BCP